jgi:hypothetical protein
MSRTTTFNGYRTRVGYGNATSFGTTPTSLAGATYLGELKSVTRSGQMVAKNSAKHLESPAGYDEKIPGFGEGGTYELTFNYTPFLERLLDSLAPDLSAQPTAGGATVNDPPRYGRFLFYLADRYGNFEYANVIADPPARTVDAEGVQTMTVTVTVAEGKPVRVAAAGAAANPGTYAAPT